MNPAGAVLKFEVGVPLTLALAYPEGKPSKSRFSGDQLMFTTTSGDRFFVEPYVQDRLNAAGVGVGQPFELEKVENWQGNRRVVEFQVRKIGTRPVANERVPEERKSNGTEKTVTPPSIPPPQMPSGPVNGNGEDGAAIMLRCYHEAINVALTAVAYAESKGLRITPDFEDVRAMAAVLCIQATGARR